jgi:phospholipase/carboxylesterase
MALLETFEVVTGPAGAPVTAAVIWMHGLGADGHDFEPIVPELPLPKTLAVRFVFPNAPLQPVTINNGHVMRAWYDVAFGDLEGRSRKPDEAGVRASVAAIEALIAREVERGVPAARIVIAGFSQGGAIALASGLRHHDQLAGIMALSTYLPLAESLPVEASAANRNIPVFFAHGSADPVIHISMARQSVERLQALDYPVQWHEYPMQHSVHPREIADIGAWLGRVLGS